MAGERQLKVRVIGDSSGVKKAFDETEQAAGSAETRFGGLAGSIGKAFVGLAAAAKGVDEILDQVGMAIENEKLGDKLTAQLDLTAEESRTAGDVAGRLYAGAYGGSMGEVNSALKSVSLNIQDLGKLSATELEGMTAKAFNLQEAFDVDVSESTRNVGSLMKNGLAKDATEAFDLITRGYQSGLDKGEDFGDTIDEYSPLFKKLGLDGSSALGLLNQGIQAGARNSDFLADALKEFQIRATDGSTTSAKGFELLGLNAAKMTAQIAAGGEGAKRGLDDILDRLRNTEDPVKRNAAAVALFGTKAEDLGDALFSLDPSEAVASLGQVGGAADKLGDTLNDNFATKWEGFKRSLKAIPGEIGGIFADFASDDTASAGVSIGRLLGLDENSDEVGQIILTLGTIRGVITDSIGAIRDIFSGDTESAGITIGKLFGLEEGSPEVGRITSSLDTLRATFLDAVQFVQQCLTQVQAFIAVIMPVLSAVFSGYLKAIGNTWALWGDDIMRVVGGAIDVVKAVIQYALDFIQGISKVFLGVMTGDWSMAWEGLKQIVTGANDAIKAIIRGALEIVSGIVGGAWNGITALTDRAWEALKAKVRDSISNVKDFVREKVDAVKSDVSNVWNSLPEITSAAWNRLKSAVASGVDGAANFARELPGRVTGAIGDLGRLLYGSGQKVIQGLIDGIGDKIGALRDKISGAVQTIKDHLPFSPAKTGPLSGRGNPFYSGQSIVNLLGEGMRSQQADLASTVAATAERIRFTPNLSAGETLAFDGQLRSLFVPAAVTAQDANGGSSAPSAVDHSIHIDQLVLQIDTPLTAENATSVVLKALRDIEDMAAPLPL